MMGSLRQSVVAHPTSAPSLPEAESPLALALNENPFAPLPAVRAAMLRSIDSTNRYPEFLPVRLRRLIAHQIDVREDQVVIGAGATGVVMQVLHAMTDPGDRIVMTAPTFDGYPIFAKMARLTPVTVPLDKHGHHDLDAMADAAADARVVVLCRPHNPSGTIEQVSDVHRFLMRVPADTVVVIDEAYIEFVEQAHRLKVRTLIQRFPNVLVVRTFSKAYGLAGMRIGYGFCSSEMARTLWTMQLPFGTSVTSLAAVAASYAAESELMQRVRLITGERDYLRMRMRSLGIRSTDSHANFVYVPPVSRPWRDVFEPNGIQVRTYNDGSVRITVGSRASTRAVLAAIGASSTTGAR